jgi:hypothetical protein
VRREEIACPFCASALPRMTTSARRARAVTLGAALTVTALSATGCGSTASTASDPAPQGDQSTGDDVTTNDGTGDVTVTDPPDDESIRTVPAYGAAPAPTPIAPPPTTP